MSDKHARYRNHYSPWSIREIEFLEKNYGKLPAKEIAQHLGRAISAVRAMALKLGIGRTGARPWSPAEIGVVKKYYAHGSGIALVRVLLPHRDKESIRKQAAKAGVTDLREWHSDAVAFLKAHYGEMPVEDIAATLNKSASAVRNKATALKLGKTRVRKWTWEENAILTTQYGNSDTLDEIHALLPHRSRQAKHKQSPVSPGKHPHPLLTKANELIKKDMGISVLTLKNREKTQIVDALKDIYPIAELLCVLQLARSCYFYHKASQRLHDKYAEIRVAMGKIFEGNYRCYGYRRLHAMLREGNTCISEKVVRRLMAEEQLIVKRAGRRRYSSYCGEIGPAPENLLARNFRACRPNEKWLTDITEFQLPAGKVYLSPVIDCFDGKVVSWSIGPRPDAKLVNGMLDDAIDTLRENEKPVIHSDRGGHYRWPGWLDRIRASGLIRSMSRKGCSSDNAACEGFFGRVKNEMYYGRNWSTTTLEDFICFLDRYIRWYNEKRIKISLGAMSPVKYRQHLGITT